MYFNVLIKKMIKKMADKWQFGWGKATFLGLGLSMRLGNWGGFGEWTETGYGARLGMSLGKKLSKGLDMGLDWVWAWS